MQLERTRQFDTPQLVAGIAFIGCAAVTGVWGAQAVTDKIEAVNAGYDVVAAQVAAQCLPKTLCLKPMDATTEQAIDRLEATEAARNAEFAYDCNITGLGAAGLLLSAGTFATRRARRRGDAIDL